MRDLCDSRQVDFFSWLKEHWRGHWFPSRIRWARGIFCSFGLGTLHFLAIFRARYWSRWVPFQICRLWGRPRWFHWRRRFFWSRVIWLWRNLLLLSGFLLSWSSLCLCNSKYRNSSDPYWQPFRNLWAPAHNFSCWDILYLSIRIHIYRCNQIVVCWSVIRWHWCIACRIVGWEPDDTVRWGKVRLTCFSLSKRDILWIC